MLQGKCFVVHAFSIYLLKHNFKGWCFPVALNCRTWIMERLERFNYFENIFPGHQGILKDSHCLAKWEIAFIPNAFLQGDLR